MTPDPAVRQTRPDEIERYLPAAIAMFLEEVGVDPRLGDGGAGYRARVAELIGAGRAFVRFEQGEVVFKAEIGALSSRVGQIQGVWVHPEWRGRGLGQSGTAAVVAHLVRAAPRREPLRQRVQHPRPARLRAHRVRAGRLVRHRAVLIPGPD